MCETNIVHIDKRIQKKKNAEFLFQKKKTERVKAWADLHLVELIV